MEGYDPSPPSTNTLNRFHETSAKLQRYKVLLRRRWWFLLLTAAIAICFEALVITGKTTEYIAIGKIVAGLQVKIGSREGEVISERFVQDFYGTQIETLESGALRNHALERVRSLHPELKEIEVEISVTQTRGSSILNVAAVGAEAKYTRVYLDALLDEYIAFRKDMLEKSIGSTMNKVIEEVLSREKLVKQTKETLDNFLRTNDLTLFEGNRNHAAAYLISLKHDLNVYETEKRIMEKMGQDSYLASKQKGQTPASLATSGAVPPVSGKSDESVPQLERRSSDLGGGLSKVEADYLNEQAELQLMEAERARMLRTYRPEHPAVKEMDDKLASNKAMLDILGAQTQAEWNRRCSAMDYRMEALKDAIKEGEGKAREANDKIVLHQAYKSEYERTLQDYQDWKKKLEQLDTAGVTGTDLVAIMERPGPAVEEQPELWIPLAIALVVGLAAGSIILLLFDRLDDRMNSFSEFQALFPNEPILGQIPEQSTRGDVTLIRPNDDRHLYAESFRNLRSSILFKNWRTGKPPKIVMVTSAVPNEGKTTSVANLSVTMALGGSRVLLVDADLRRGGVNEMFKVSAEPGLSDVLTSKLHWRDAVQETGTKGLHVLPRGEALDQTSELFLSTLAEEVIKEMGEEYDYVIIDSAPVLVADDTASFAPKVDTVLFVVRMSSTMARLTAKALDLLYERQVNVGGVILNRSSTNLKEYTYYNYASYYSVSSQKAKAASS
ncbi:MAG: polysaccharide biosynthesis tyrosine autokinase [Roseimicrobium sp.]